MSENSATRYYLSTTSHAESSLVVVSSFRSLKERNTKTLEFLTFTWENPADVTYPFIDRVDTAKENMNAMLEYQLSGPIRKYVLSKQYKYQDSRTHQVDVPEFAPVERNIINAMEFPYGLRLLEIIIIATESLELKAELSILKNFILLINNPSRCN